MEKNIRITSAEISQLWAAYMNDSLAICTLSYFLKNVKDSEIKEVVQYALQLSETHTSKLNELFNQENFPIPYGFKLEEDVDLSAPPLYSDTFILNFVHKMGFIGISAYSMALSLAVRNDLFSYFSDCLDETRELIKRANQVLLNKGLYIRSPYITFPEKVEFVQNQSFIHGLVGKKRPLLAQEIAYLYSNIQRNALGKATLIGFAQTAELKEVREFFRRGLELSSKHIEVFSAILQDEYLPAPMTWDTEVYSSTTKVFSDKLMMFQVSSLIAIGIGYYGTSFSASPRTDLASNYYRLMAEVGLYSQDAANILIKHNWMEEPPKTTDRNELI